MDNHSTVLIDLDGVVWRGEVPIPGADRGIEMLRTAGCRVAFFTNNSFSQPIELLAHLKSQGIDVDRSDLLSSAMAAATLCSKGERVLAVGGAGIRDALEDNGIDVVACDGAGPTDGFDAVVVGVDFDFNYARLAQAMAAVDAGARLIGTNSDATYPTPTGERPGGGSMVAAVATASGKSATIAGKPTAPAVALVRARLGLVDLMIGDRPSTDGAFALALEAAFGLVLSGVTPKGHGAVQPPPDREADDLLEMATLWVADLGARPRTS